jgi:alkylation response protein AidB-like acyl-CoA dehydrogenase
MNFDFSADQGLLRDELRKFFVNEVPLARSRTLMEQRGTHDAAAWQGLAGLGATALMLPEACGGAGLGALELCVLAEEAGRQLAPLPLASTMYLAAQALLLGADEAQQARWLARIAQGEPAALAAPLGEEANPGLLRYAGGLLNGDAPLASDGEAARVAVVLARDEAGAPCWVAAELDATVTRRRLNTLDGARPYAALGFAATQAERLAHADDALSLLQRVRDRAAVLLAFEQLGGADAALEMAAAYARERKAFGRTIGSYQGIKHKLADLYTANQLARAHCWYGAWALDKDSRQAAGADELALAAAAARVAATDAFSLAAQENIQTHGGMGVTWETDCHLFYRRARQYAVMLGSVHEWRERLVVALASQLDMENSA